MKTIASFTIDHTVLCEGIYISRIDGDAVTYDIRMRKPNRDDFLSTGSIHTLEHLLATYARNSEIADKIIYVGPMGCRTGMYLIVRDPDHRAVIDMLIRAMKFAGEFEGEIPGATEPECGNYLDHDLAKAKEDAINYYNCICDWTPEMLKYPKQVAQK